MSINILSKNYQLKVKEDTKLQLKSYWTDLELPEALLTKFEESQLEPQTLRTVFLEENFSPLKVYFTQLLIDIIYINELVFEDNEEEIFDYWEGSEFASMFFEKHKENIIETSKIVLSYLENHFINYLLLNYSSLKIDPTEIKLMPEVGDFEEFLYLESGKGIKIEKSDIEENDLVRLKNYSFTDSLIEEKISFKDKDLALRPGSVNGIQNNEIFTNKIRRSIDVLKSLAPELLELFKEYTHTIIALDEPTMVSFSLQSLPGYSSINLYNRDFVDCIDDLIHENGHHYLNYILNSNELIVEEPDKAYFSPWRLSPRPIRGIYHGVFTFYWALNLFSTLHNHSESNQFFSPKEQEKIRFRFVEEYYKLSFCKHSLQIARENQLITDFGWELIQNVMTLVEEQKDLAVTAEATFNSEDRTSIAKMKESLKNL